MNEREPYTEAVGAEYQTAPQHFREVLRNRWWVVALIALLCAGAALAFSFVRGPEYKASTKLLVGQKEQGGAEQLSNLGSDVQGLQSLTPTMAEAVKTRSMAEGVISQLDLELTPEAFLSRLDAKQVGTSQFLDVSYEDTDPRRAERVADTVGKVFSERIDATDFSRIPATVTVWERAALEPAPAIPDPVRNGLLALGLGLVLGLGSAFLLEGLDNRWRSSQEAERITGVPTFAVIPKFKARNARRSRTS